jgi:hypothetical protein
MEPSATPSTSTPTDQSSSQPTVTPNWTQIFANDFEKDLGYFNDPGANARRYSKGRGKRRKKQHSGYKSLELRDDTDTSLSFTNPFPVESYSALKVEFWYKSFGFDDASDGFVLEFADGVDGTEWATKGSWTYKVNDFTSNNKWRSASVKFEIDTDTMRIRFRNKANSRKDKLYIDDVTVSGGADPSAMPTSSPSLSPAPSSQPSVTPICTQIFKTNFEKNLGEFNDPGGNARRYSGKKRQKQHSGYNSLELRDDTDTSLSFTNLFPVSDYSTLKVEFWYKSSRFNDASDGFVLESSDDDSDIWFPKGSWTYKSNGFDGNNKWRSASVQFHTDEAATMRIRFRNEADRRKEKLYIDDVIVTGCYDPSAA